MKAEASSSTSSPSGGTEREGSLLIEVNLNDVKYLPSYWSYLDQSLNILGVTRQTLHNKYNSV